MSDHPNLEDLYRKDLILTLSRELRKGTRDFDRLVRSAEGAYPSDVLAVLKYLGADGGIGQTVSENWQCRAEASPAGRIVCAERVPMRGDVVRFPEPHPLDFDWRFTASTLDVLCRHLELDSRPCVAVLGAPTLYKHLIDAAVNATLFDKNTQVVATLREQGYRSATECDLFDFRMNDPCFDCVIADPPWYLEHYRAFLQATYAMLVPGGTLLMSVLPRLTRPSASSDRQEIVNVAARLGLDLVQVSAGALRYESPPFEAEALRADNLTVGQWRRGDLYSFVRRPTRQRKRKRHPKKPSDQEAWACVPYSGMTIKIKLGNADASEPFEFKAASLTGELRLRSVSRRSPVRSRINFWTSRNLALTITKPEMTVQVLNKLARGESAQDVLPLVAYEYQLSETELNRLHGLVELLDSEARLA